MSELRPYPGSQYAYCEACCSTQVPVVLEDESGFRWACLPCLLRAGVTPASVPDDAPQEGGISDARCNHIGCESEISEECDMCKFAYCIDHISEYDRSGVLCDNCAAVDFHFAKSW